MVYTLGEAAKAVGKSKATLSKAVKAGKISAKRNDDGSFSIEPVELHRVYPPALPSTVEGERYEIPKETPGNAYEVMELRIKLEAAQQRIEDLKDDRDQWRQQANRLLSQSPNTPPQGFLARLFKR